MSSEPPSTTAATLLARQVSFFRSVRETRPKENASVAQALEGIRGGKWRDQVEQVRRILKSRGKACADQEKVRTLGAFTFSGVFTERAKTGLENHSGSMALDFDGLGTDLETARAKLKADRYMLSVNTSPSGLGLKALIAVSATDRNSHERDFAAAESHFGLMGLKVDPTGKDVCRLCFTSYDPELWIRDPSSPVAILSAPALSALTASSASSAPSARHREIVGRLVQRNELERSLSTTPRLARIFRAFVESRPASPGQRNACLTKLVPALYSVVAEDVVVRLSLAWFNLNRAVFKDTAEQHERETRAMVKGCAKTYTSALTSDDRQIYELLDNRGQAAFRICRDLASRGKKQVFFLSCDELGERVECDSRQSHRILTGFMGLGLLQRTTLGQARAPGVVARATEWKWLLS